MVLKHLGGNLCSRFTDVLSTDGEKPDRRRDDRGEPHTVARALARSLAHLAYHRGQVTLIARLLVGPERWKVITIPRGGSRAHDDGLGFRPGG